MKIQTTLLLVATLCTALPAAAHEDAQAPEKLGKVSFHVSCNAEAQKEFNRAVALYHSFYWPEVKKAFDAVLAADPACAMAHWGHAMVLMDNPFLWPLTGKALPEGLAAVEKAKALGARTQRERDYIAAVEQFYKDHEKLDHKTRVAAYEKAMQELAARYPDDIEARVLYGLVLSATFDPTDKTYAKQLKAAEILEKIFASHPEHPGVAHYLIHSYDYPPIAERGLPAAKRFAQVAASTPHAQHMPSHIFTRLGHWQDSITSNIASANASKELRSKLHAWDYMAYAYLQSGQDNDAKRILDEANAIKKIEGENFTMAYAFAAIPSRYALERGRWADAAALKLHPGEFDFAWQRFPHAEAVHAFATGLGAARTGDASAARKQIERLGVLREALLAAKQAYWAEQAEIQISAVQAWTEKAEGKNEQALKTLRAAADHEDATEKNVVTPGPVMPARELLGEMLLELKQPAAALKEFEASIHKEPNRFRGLYGAAQAAEQSGDKGKARAYYAKLLDVCAKADSERPELKQAKTFLARN
jgi:tetratricopeptide (TPR) repeat protein